MTNFLDKEDEAVLTVAKASTSHPVVTIQGPPSRLTFRSQSIRLRGEVTLPNCSSAVAASSAAVAARARRVVAIHTDRAGERRLRVMRCSGTGMGASLPEASRPFEPKLGLGRGKGKGPRRLTRRVRPASCRPAGLAMPPATP